MTGLGTHILLDLYGCEPDRLNDLEFLRQMSLEGVRRSGATIMGDHFKQFEPQGVSGIIIIAESHLSLHSWPEFGYIAMDYFTCGSRIDIDAAIAHFEEALCPQKVVKSRHTRGSELAGREWAVPSHGRAKGPATWFTEYYGEGEQPKRAVLGYQYAVERELVRTRSPFQEILVMENPVYGRMLFLDGLVMTTERDEFVYHEMLAHVPLVVHGDPKRVLIVGGGDGGLLREVLRHKQVESVDMVEIDPKVVEIAREHLPGIACAFDESRAHLHFEDGAEFVRRARGVYDLILVDSTEPMGAGEVLYENAFFEDCKKALKSDTGLFAAQALSAWVHENEQKAMFANLRRVWSDVVPYVASIPTYPGGLWTFVLCGERKIEPVPLDIGRAKEIARHCRYYNPEIHKSCFSLPNFLAEKLGRSATARH
ncbi:MAG: polyamine aminopropyltransferase [bacterium]